MENAGGSSYAYDAWNEKRLTAVSSGHQVTTQHCNTPLFLHGCMHVDVRGSRHAPEREARDSSWCTDVASNYAHLT